MSGKPEDEGAVLFVHADREDWLEFDDLLGRRKQRPVFDE